MCRGGRRPDQAGAARAGPSEQRAPKRSARRRREAYEILPLHSNYCSIFCSRRVFSGLSNLQDTLRFWTPSTLALIFRQNMFQKTLSVNKILRNKIDQKQ
ncbi:hypothetical protein SGRA_0107 [Saprospira grandis str. Lewin]|uniref:Uncharacterized protein n=1 Tax=Saprospira grandis (strain Lewin) TaxID=984262 RepID=H6L4H3_SAPGL|nr:hypothetical protein SGRA_0107 [Saprospira grandis str. Lewin]